jgi:hypothetical protein
VGPPRYNHPKVDCSRGANWSNIDGQQLRANGQKPRASICIYSKIYGQAERAISNGQLNVLLRLHIRPINVVVFHGPSKGLNPWEISSRGRFRAYMRSALILTQLRYPAMPLA